jgi:hypothetical protein
LADPRDPPAASTLVTKAPVLLAKFREDSRFEWKKEADSVLDAVIKESIRTSHVFFPLTGQPLDPRLTGLPLLPAEQDSIQSE